MEKRRRRSRLRLFTRPLHLTGNLGLPIAGIILTGLHGCFSKDGISRYRSLSVGKASASCTRWRILHFQMEWDCWIMQCTGLALLGLELRFLAPMISIYVNLQKIQRIFGEDFRKRVSEGFQVTPLWHQGFIRDDGRSNYVQTVKTARWEYSTRPVYGWGDVKSKQKSTAGWLAAFPVFEPHWQICMAGGLSTGWIEWDGERFEFENAPSYSEKNWGAGFPRKWFWVQCNVFEGASGEVALTAAGGLRKLPGLIDNYENAALIGVHYGGSFYEFVPWTGTISWDIAQWGFWHMSAENDTHVIELEATAGEHGTPLRAPTTEAGFVTACKDTCFGDLRLQLWERRNDDGGKGKMILDVSSNMAALEVGGGPWFSGWKGSTSSPEVVRRALRVPIDVESFFPLPIFKPAGL
ncbi:probable tocopherol cyclase, chloroplastic isoform X2 [Musa acuminata AAA Group]|uniref:probable tocopherol cyclase, chloroplastic isoform X2 n=1 Tax=Musa acuminata AAA Group TaxID=214697 RepID=UPI0031CF1867